MRERRREPGFTEKSLTDVGLYRQRLRQNLDRHVSVELDFAGEVDDPHASPAELTLERVLAGECLLEINEVAIDHGHWVEVLALRTAP